MTIENRTAVVVLAGGQGKRIKSKRPKLLQSFLGQPILGMLLETIKHMHTTSPILVLGKNHHQFQSFLDSYPDLSACLQVEQKGTADALASASELIKGVKAPPYTNSKILKGTAVEAEYTLTLLGDLPAVSAETINRFIESTIKSNCALGIIGFKTPHPSGLGRLVIEDQELKEIVEHKDCNSAQLEIDICNTGVIMGKSKILFDLMGEIDNDNAQKEFYMPSVFQLAQKNGHKSHVFISEDWRSFSGINDREQLADLENYMSQKKISQIMRDVGVSFSNPGTSTVFLDCEIGNDSCIGPQFFAKSKVKIGEDCQIGKGVTLENTTIEDEATIEDHCYLKNVTVKRGEVVRAGSIQIL